MGLLFGLLFSLSVSHLWNNKYLRPISKVFSRMPRLHDWSAPDKHKEAPYFISHLFGCLVLSRKVLRRTGTPEGPFGRMKRNFSAESVLCTLTIPIMECQLCCLKQPDTCNNMCIHWCMKQGNSPGFVISWSQALHPSPHITLCPQKMRFMAHFVARFMAIITQIHN